MNESIQLAGFVAAHAILQVSRGKLLTIPLVVVEKEDGVPQFIQVTGKSSEEAVANGDRMLRQPIAGARYAVMAFEAYLNLPPSRTDAIFLQVRCYQPKAPIQIIAVPFRAAKNPGGFAVFRPKLIANEDEPAPSDALEAFWRGVALHPTGQAEWLKYQDNSR